MVAIKPTLLRGNLRVRVLYVWAMILVSIFVVTVVWFSLHYILVKAVPTAVTLAQDMGTNSTDYNHINTFFENVDTWLPILGILVIGLGGYVYSQRRGRQIYVE